MTIEAIKVLPSVFKGITFRSRTEARWAVLFETMGIVWNYEPEGHAMSDRGYLPDFYLPQFDLWFEVKPDTTDGSEEAVLVELVRATGKPGIIAYGPPAPNSENLAYFEPDGERHDDRYSLAEDRRDDGVYWLASANNRYFVIGGPGTQTEHDRLPTVGERPIERAYAAARAERFGT